MDYSVDSLTAVFGAKPPMWEGPWAIGREVEGDHGFFLPHSSEGTLPWASQHFYQPIHSNLSQTASHTHQQELPGVIPSSTSQPSFSSAPAESSCLLHLLLHSINDSSHRLAGSKRKPHEDFTSGHLTHHPSPTNKVEDEDVSLAHILEYFGTQEHEDYPGDLINELCSKTGFTPEDLFSYLEHVDGGTPDTQSTSCVEEASRDESSGVPLTSPLFPLPTEEEEVHQDECACGCSDKTHSDEEDSDEEEDSEETYDSAFPALLDGLGLPGPPAHTLCVGAGFSWSSTLKGSNKGGHQAQTSDSSGTPQKSGRGVFGSFEGDGWGDYSLTQFDLSFLDDIISPLRNQSKPYQLSVADGSKRCLLAALKATEEEIGGQLRQKLAPQSLSKIWEASGEALRGEQLKRPSDEMDYYAATRRWSREKVCANCIVEEDEPASPLCSSRCEEVCVETGDEGPGDQTPQPYDDSSVWQLTKKEIDNIHLSPPAVCCESSVASQLDGLCCGTFGTPICREDESSESLIRFHLPLPSDSSEAAHPLHRDPEVSLEASWANNFLFPPQDFNGGFSIQFDSQGLISCDHFAIAPFDSSSESHEEDDFHSSVVASTLRQLMMNHAEPLFSSGTPNYFPTPDIFNIFGSSHLPRFSFRGNVDLYDEEYFDRLHHLHLSPSPARGADGHFLVPQDTATGGQVGDESGRKQHISLLEMYLNQTVSAANAVHGEGALSPAPSTDELESMCPEDSISCCGQCCASEVRVQRANSLMLRFKENHVAILPGASHHLEEVDSLPAHSSEPPSSHNPTKRFGGVLMKDASQQTDALMTEQEEEHRFSPAEVTLGLEEDNSSPSFHISRNITQSTLKGGEDGEEERTLDKAAELEEICAPSEKIEECGSDHIVECISIAVSPKSFCDEQPEDEFIIAGDDVDRDSQSVSLSPIEFTKTEDGSSEEIKNASSTEGSGLPNFNRSVSVSSSFIRSPIEKLLEDEDNDDTGLPGNKYGDFISSVLSSLAQKKHQMSINDCYNISTENSAECDFSNAYEFRHPEKNKSMFSQMFSDSFNAPPEVSGSGVLDPCSHSGTLPEFSENCDQSKNLSSFDYVASIFVQDPSNVLFARNQFANIDPIIEGISLLPTGYRNEDMLPEPQFQKIHSWPSNLKADPPLDLSVAPLADFQTEVLPELSTRQRTSTGATSTEDLFTSPRTHFRPISTEPEAPPSSENHRSISISDTNQLIDGIPVPKEELMYSLTGDSKKVSKFFPVFKKSPDDSQGIASTFSQNEFEFLPINLHLPSEMEQDITQTSCTVWSAGEDSFHKPSHLFEMDESQLFGGEGDYGVYDGSDMPDELDFIFEHELRAGGEYTHIPWHSAGDALARGGGGDSRSTCSVSTQFYQLTSCRDNTIDVGEMCEGGVEECHCSADLPDELAIDPHCPLHGAGALYTQPSLYPGAYYTPETNDWVNTLSEFTSTGQEITTPPLTTTAGGGCGGSSLRRRKKSRKSVGGVGRKRADSASSSGSSLIHPHKPCSYFMEGSCQRLDCKFSHDLRSIPCRFWQEASCFKAHLCPFLHSASFVRPSTKEESVSTNTSSKVVTQEGQGEETSGGHQSQKLDLGDACEFPSLNNTDKLVTSSASLTLQRTAELIFPPLPEAALH